jgi:hypothetical protein
LPAFERREWFKGNGRFKFYGHKEQVLGDYTNAEDITNYTILLNVSIRI